MRDMRDVVFHNHNDNLFVGPTRGGSLELTKDADGLLMRAKLFDIQPGQGTYTR